MNIKKDGLHNYLLDKQIDCLDEKVTEIEYKKGYEIYSPSKRYTAIYEIVEGAIKLGSVSPSGIEIMHEILVQGEFFGNLRLLDDNAGLFGNLKGLHKPFSEFSKTLVPTLVRCYEYDFFKHLITNDPNVAEWFYEKIVSRWCKTESLFISVLSLPPRERIQLVYQFYDTKIKVRPNKETLLNTIISFKDMANLTGTTRQLVAITLQSIQNEVPLS